MSDLETLIVMYKAHYFVIRVIKVEEEKYYILSILANYPVLKEMEYYYQKLVEWGVDTSLEEMNKLSII
ncbi:MAG: hypothetical protein ACFFBH_16585 [Promethearchaeota archaeon]